MGKKSRETWQYDRPLSVCVRCSYKDILDSIKELLSLQIIIQVSQILGSRALKCLVRKFIHGDAVSEDVYVSLRLGFAAVLCGIGDREHVDFFGWNVNALVGPVVVVVDTSF